VRGPNGASFLVLFAMPWIFKEKSTPVIRTGKTTAIFIPKNKIALHQIQ